MASLNKVMLIGRLTRDPEARYTPSGVAVTEFGFAVNRYYTSNGERKEDTCFLDITAWGRQGEQVRNYLRKGSQAFIEGYLSFSEWQTQEGQKRSKIRIVAERVQFLDAADRRTTGLSRGGDRAEAPPAASQGAPGRQEPSPDMDFPGPEEDESEAPF